MPTAPEFFRGTYFDDAYAWQRIDSDWLQGASALALSFDQAVNNTSLVIALELGDGDVLLFAADAQVGNWLSWHDLSWTLADKSTVTAPDSSRARVFYKVGHHASHNATLEAQGLELMDKIAYAMISVNAEMALKKRWGRKPFQAAARRPRQAHGQPHHPLRHVCSPRRPGSGLGRDRLLRAFALTLGAAASELPR